eukprot:TRINITY_DN9158_c0_g1_i1.p1 TRINITY_DN9158_c0_g1~~TRINITY_DN9158_c0_g1_i1.p1  ORF type:complete len:601 (+),score=122.64 TRINITY_DN9158_c0_g1_i1:238-2040(+)
MPDSTYVKPSRGSGSKEGGGVQAMIEYEQRQHRMQAEEREDLIQSLMAEGHITEEEAQVRLARMAMHGKVSKEEEKGMKIKGVVMAGADYQTTDQILEDLLDTRSKFLLVRCFKDATGLTRLEQNIALDRSKRAKASYRHPCPSLRNFVQSRTFESIIGFIMIFNAITIGISASYWEPVEWVQIMEYVFTAVFVFEIVLRVICDGWTWFFTWINFTDTLLIVLSGVIPTLILEPLGVSAGSEVRAVQVIRILRIARLVRMVRMIKQFRIMWKLVQGLLDSGKVLFWMHVLLGSVIYVISIFSVYWIGRVPELKDDEFAQEHFGTVTLAMFTLFQVATLDSWTFIVRPLIAAAPGSATEIVVIFLVTIMLSTIVSLNLVTAVVVQSAFQRAQEDEELIAKELKEMKEAEVEELRDIFLEIDEDQSGYLSRREYDDAFKYNRRVIDKFAILDIDRDQREEIWELLDDGNGDVSVERFATLLIQLQGEPKAKDGFTIVKTMSMVNKQYGQIQKKLEAQQALVEKTKQECQLAHRQLGGCLQEMVELLHFMGACIPTPPAPTKKAEINQQRARNQDRLLAIQEEDRPESPTNRQQQHPQTPQRS